MKRNIFDLCTDTKDCYLAVIEVILLAIQNQVQYDRADLFFLVCLLESGFRQQRYSLSTVRSRPTEARRGRGGGRRGPGSKSVHFLLNSVSRAPKTISKFFKTLQDDDDQDEDDDDDDDSDEDVDTDPLIAELENENGGEDEDDEEEDDGNDALSPSDEEVADLLEEDADAGDEEDEDDNDEDSDDDEDVDIDGDNGQ